MSYGEFGEEEEAINLVEIVVDKPTVRIRICKIQVGGLTHLFNFNGLFPNFWHLTVPWDTPAPLHGHITFFGPKNAI